jgi:hypothetical protein
VRPVTSGTRVSLAFKIKSADNYCAAALASTEVERVNVFVEQLHVIGQRNTRDGVVGVLLSHEYSLGACQRGELVGIDRAITCALKARFPDARLISVVAKTRFSRYIEIDGPKTFDNDVYEMSPEEIERIGQTVADDVLNKPRDSDVPFLRANSWVGAMLDSSFQQGGNTGNEYDPSVGESIYFHAALIVPMGTPKEPTG